MPVASDLGLFIASEAPARSPIRPPGVYGSGLRGQGRLGRDMAFLTAMVEPSGPAGSTRSGTRSSTSREWKKTLDFYVSLMNGTPAPPGASSERLSYENLALFNSGKCGHVDRRHRSRHRS